MRVTTIVTRSLRFSSPFVTLALLLLMGLPAAHAQGRTPSSDTARATAGRRGMCWRPRPAPECRRYFISEFAYERALSSTSPSPAWASDPDRDFEGRYVWSFGPMSNRGPSAAWGVLAAAGLPMNQPVEFGLLRVEGRYRKWLGKTTGADFSAGVAQKTVFSGYSFNRYRLKARGLTAAAGVENGLLGVDARVDVLHGGGRPRRAALVGVRAGGYLAPLAMFAAIVHYVVWLGPKT